MNRKRLLGLSALAAALGCAQAQRIGWQTMLPGMRAEFHVDSVVQLDDSLDVRLSSADLTRRIFAFADDPACRDMLVTGRTIEWGRSEPFGPLHHGDATCPVSGIGDLEQWRDARARTTRAPVIRSITRARVVYQDETYVMLQGGFSIAALFGWSPGTNQVRALIRRSPECEKIDVGSDLSVEFRASGRPALVILTGSGLCPIEGLLPAPRDAQSPAEPGPAVP
jgi:hypothetical protein